VSRKNKPSLPPIPPALQEAIQASGESLLAEPEETPGEMAKRITGELTAAKKPDPEKAKMLERAYRFDFELERPREVWKGSFIHTIPTVKVRRLIGVMRAEYTGGQPWEAIDPFSRELVQILTHFAFTLESKNAPDHWSSDLEGLNDVEVLHALYGRCLTHEATFFGSD
jgi:hypothetical protein